MAENWQDATYQQVKLIAGRLNELLSTGLDLLHSELGVDFGVKPEIPPWLIFLAACIGLVLMVAMWASACRGLFKKRPTIIEVESTKPAPIKVAKAEEPKKKKRKPTEKKSQPNGSAVAELQEEVRVTEDNLPLVPHHSPQIKAEKASEVKKTKKKQKRAVKEATSHGKESEEVSGTWETKVSNKEKREQRRKDKTTGDGSGSPGGVDPLPSTPPQSTKASPKAVAPGSGSEKKEKKKKGKFCTSNVVVSQQVSDEEREKAEPAADGTGKSKKKKKKKKQPEDAEVTGQESEEPSKKVVTEAKVKKQPIQEPPAPTVQAVNAAAMKARVEQPVVVQNTAPITQVPPQPAETEPTAKQNSLPAPTHKKPEESQPSKPVMKKKRARRET
uniref:Metadherin a n=1 Tax=Hucho hucho TaxID=62062 RepID=A0A4W5PK30_9TELE